MRLHHAAIAALVLLLGVSELAAQTSRSARLIFVRPQNPMPTAAPAFIEIDGARVGTLKNGDALHIDKPPGRYVLAVDGLADPGTHQVTAEVRAGETYTFTIRLNWPMFWVGAGPHTSPLAAFQIAPLPKSAGAAEMAAVRR